MESILDTYYEELEEVILRHRARYTQITLNKVIFFENEITRTMLHWSRLETYLEILSSAYKIEFLINNLIRSLSRTSRSNNNNEFMRNHKKKEKKKKSKLQR